MSVLDRPSRAVEGSGWSELLAGLGRPWPAPDGDRRPGPAVTCRWVPDPLDAGRVVCVWVADPGA